MSRIRGLELLFNLEKKNLKSKEDCIVALFHCLLINEKFQCVGISDEWPKTLPSGTELLPTGWNSNQDVYSLRYISKDMSRVLLKITKMEHILQVDVMKNKDAIASTSVSVENHISNYDEYSTAYKDLDSLCESFQKDIMQKLEPKKSSPPKGSTSESSIPSAPLRNPRDLHKEDPYSGGNPLFPSGVGGSAPLRNPRDLYREDPYSGGNPRFPPRVGGSDLDPFGRGGGGMIMDPSSFGIPARPPLSDFGVGGPGNLPRGAVPPGARFDPIRPPFSTGRYDPDPNPFKPPDFGDDYIL